MTIAIDINDVIRAFTKNFAKIYQKEYDRTFEDIEITTYIAKKYGVENTAIKDFADQK